MKFRPIACLSLLAGALAGTPILADTINFDGSLTQQTCTLSFFSTMYGQHGTLQMGQVALAEFESVPKPGSHWLQSTKPATIIAVDLVNCPPGVRPYMRFHSPMSARAVNPQSGPLLLMNTIPESAGGAVGLYVEILLNDSAYTTAEILPAYAANPARHTNDPVITTNWNGHAQLFYWARYARDYYGVVKPGAYSSYTYYTVNYD